MGLPAYIVNWDEFTAELAKDIVVDNVDLDTSGVEAILNEFFPDVINLLENIKEIMQSDKDKYKNYDQRIIGFHIKTNEKDDEYILEFKNDEKNMYITGITCNHSHVEGVDDFFNLSVINEKAELIFEQVYLKDALQHKYLNKFFPVPAGYTIRITHYNPSLQEKHVWYDLEYLEYYGQRENREWDIPDNDEKDDEKSDLLYFCDGSLDANSINTDFWDWSELSKRVFRAQTEKELTGEYWGDRNKILDLFSTLGTDRISRNKITPTDFHKFLFKAWSDSKNGKVSINKTWGEFNEWCNNNLPCLDDLQRASLFFTVKCRICSNIFPDNIKFTEGKIPDVISSYLSKLPYKVVDWIDYNDIVIDSEGTIVGATAYDLYVPSNPDVLKEFTSFVNIEPQSLLFDEYSLHASNPHDYVNTSDNFWGAIVPPSLVDWTMYKTEEYRNAKTSEDNEAIKGIIVAETVIHEYGHCVDYYYNNIIGHMLTKTQEWMDIRGTNSNHVVKDKPANETGGMPMTNTGYEAPVTDYGCSDPAEDFAEAFVVYIVNPDFMKLKYPQRFNFMEEYVKPLI